MTNEVNEDTQELDIAANAIMKCLDTLADIEQLHEDNILFSLMVIAEVRFRQFLLYNTDADGKAMLKEVKREAREVLEMRDNNGGEVKK